MLHALGVTSCGKYLDEMIVGVVGVNGEDSAFFLWKIMRLRLSNHSSVGSVVPMPFSRGGNNGKSCRALDENVWGGREVSILLWIHTR